MDIHRDPVFEESIRGDLTIAMLKHADFSGETIRAFLFAASSAALALLLTSPQPIEPYHKLAEFFFLLATGIVIVSWFIQKRKALRRYKAVLKGGVPALLQSEREFRSHWWLKNTRWDTAAAVLLFAGAATEVIGALAQ
jgi:hypothetical protein